MQSSTVHFETPAETPRSSLISKRDNKNHNILKIQFASSTAAISTWHNYAVRDLY